MRPEHSGCFFLYVFFFHRTEDAGEIGPTEDTKGKFDFLKTSVAGLAALEWRDGIDFGENQQKQSRHFAISCQWLFQARR